MLLLQTQPTKDISLFHQIFIFLTQSLQGGAACKNKQFKPAPCLFLFCLSTVTDLIT